MIIKTVEIDKFRAFKNNVSFDLGKRITVISGRNATQKTTLLGMIGQPFAISQDHPMYGCKTIDGYNFRSQFKEKFRISPVHDVIGEHKWKLLLHKNTYEKDYYSIESIARIQHGQETSLRFWNSESKNKGAGYIQLPVYFLSLSRLFPIGETTKTKAVHMELSQDELEYCIKSYRTILSIQYSSGRSSVSVEKAATRTFTGVCDDIHDIFTNSAGEGNVMRIVLAVLSFKRLQEQYRDQYKGGILLIDELDATIYGFSQTKLVEYLYEAAAQYRIQVVFTSHSHVVLKAVNKLQRKERIAKGIKLPLYAYDCSIVYLDPIYDEKGNRTIVPRNIFTSSELNQALNDIDLVAPALRENKVNVYCEDGRAMSFLKYMLGTVYPNSWSMYMSFIDINLGWTNYIQLYDRGIPEFRSNIIVLDGDVPNMADFKKWSKKVEESKNILFLPLVIEKDLFVLLKNHAAFLRFEAFLSNSPRINYDICFNSWPLDASDYKTLQFKEWFAHVETIVGNQDILFAFWCSENRDMSNEFLEKFIRTFNELAERNALDSLPPSENESEIEV